MLTIAQLNEQLQAEVNRVGGGYLKVDPLGADNECQLFVHEGTELGKAKHSKSQAGAGQAGAVHWHLWEGVTFVKADLLEVLKTWPLFNGQTLDQRVGIWFKEYRRQRNRKTGKVRWKDIGVGDIFYPDIFPWDDLEHLSDDSVN